ncbi:hypothetical protein A4S06_10940 [Erysipelotrichaceae bacterium MTC7]|nr:hypothetical protein A4S06_10940 [Erysipelotrichaceae bacterium MTC7]
MATTSLWEIKGKITDVIAYTIDEKKTSLNDAVDYTVDSSKTIDRELVSCLNCMDHDPVQSMINTKRQFQDDKPIVCFHGYQSFLPGEVDHKTAHEIGVKYAQEMWGDKYQVVISTHTDKDHAHSHFVVNSTSFVDGKRYQNNRRDKYEMRIVSDKICKEYGLSIIEKPKRYGKTRAYQHNLMNVRDRVRADLDRLIAIHQSTDSLFRELQREGYTIDNSRRYMKLIPPGNTKGVRLKSLGDNYTMDAIQERVMENHFKKIERPSPYEYYEKKKFEIRPYYEKYKKGELNGFQRLYLHYQYVLGIIPKENKLKWRDYSKELKNAIKEMDAISSQTIFMCSYNISTNEDLDSVEKALIKHTDELIKERRVLYNARRTITNDDDLKQNKEKVKDINKTLKQAKKQIGYCEGIRTRAATIEAMKLERARRREEYIL